MRQWVIASILTIGLSQAAAGAAAIVVDPPIKDASDAYQCTFKDGRSMTVDGEMGNPSGMDEWFMKHYDNFIFDTSTATLSVVGDTTQWAILREGGAGWDLIAHLPGDDPVYNVLRVQGWQAPVTFSMTDGTDIYSGTCRKIG